MSLAVSSTGSASAAASLLSTDSSSSADDVSALQLKLAAAQQAFAEAEATNDADEAARQQALVEQYTAAIQAAQPTQTAATSKAAASASSAGGAGDPSGTKANPFAATNRADLSVLNADGSATGDDGDGDDAAETSRPTTRSKQAVEAYRANMAAGATDGDAEATA